MKMSETDRIKNSLVNVSTLSRTSDYYNPDRDIPDIELIEYIVNKEIPCKFIKSYSRNGTETWLCPNCRRKLKRAWQSYNHYCPKCGQRIDWEEGETK